jgi:hypothetical protein
MTETMPRRNPKIEEAPLQDELMLFDPSSAKFFVLNGTMAYLWRSCDGSKSLNQIATALVDEFSGVTSEEAWRDIEAAAAELHSLGLLVD